MNDYKLLAFDMDGTLLTNKNTILPDTLNVLQQASLQGIATTITTGRSLQGIEEYLRLLPLSVPVITCNGAMVISLDGEILFEKNLEPEDALKILNHPRGPETRLIFWCENKLYIDKETESTKSYAKLSNAAYTVYDNPVPFAQKGITKILWIDEPDVHTRYKKHFSQAGFSNVTYCVSKPEFLEFFHKDVSKGTALEFLCHYLNIPASQTIAFGDGDNDVPLLTTAGLGIAMENASQLAKEAADFVTASNEDNGIGTALRKFFSKIPEK